MEIPDKEKIGKRIDTKLKEVMHEPKHRSSQIISYKRENNIIIHGMAEDVSISDTDKVQDIFEAIQAKYEPVTMFPLGRKIEGKPRPLMVRLISE